MKCQIISAALLLLATTDLSFGRSLRPYDQNSDVINQSKKGLPLIFKFPWAKKKLTNRLGRDSTSFLVDGYPETLNFFGKRLDVPEVVPEESVPEGVPATAGGERGGSPSVSSNEEPNTESDGGETGSSEGTPAGPALPPGTMPPPQVLRPELYLDPPEGLNDADLTYWNALNSPPAGTWSDSQYILWTSLTKKREEPQVQDLIDELKKIPASNVELTSSFQAHLWAKAGAAYRKTNPPGYKTGGLLSTRLGQWIANSPNPVHVLYGSGGVSHAPENSFLSMSELPIVTGPNSLVPIVYRWNVDSYKASINTGADPQYEIIWKAGQPPLGGPLLTDFTNDPRAAETEALAASAAGGSDPAARPDPVSPDDSGTAPNPVPPDDPVAPADPVNPPDSEEAPAEGCVICGLGCVCS